MIWSLYGARFGEKFGEAQRYSAENRLYALPSPNFAETSQFGQRFTMGLTPSRF